MKRFIGKAIVLLVVFVGVIAAYMIVNNEGEEEKDSKVMGTTTLPIINFVSNEAKVNYINGYTMDMDANYIRDSINVVGDERYVDFVITKYTNNISKLTYEIRSLDGNRLIVSEGITDFEQDSEYVRVRLNLSSMVKDNIQYQLKITLGTELHSEINFYTRVIVIPNNNINKQLEFVKYFSDATMDENKSKELNQYREYDSERDHENLGYVDIYTTQNQLTWGELAVEKITETRVMIKEMYDGFGEYVLSYVVRAVNDYDTYQYYNVTEYFRVRQGASQMYLYAYERKMDQVFDATNQNISATRLNLGIDSDLTAEYKTSAGGTYIAFVKERTLWCMNLSTNRITSIFTYSSPNFDDIRANYAQHDIKVVSVNGKGDVVFLVYGYMNKGEREGKCGVSIFRYTREKNIVEEILYLPSTKPYSILKDTAGKLAHVNDNNVVKIMLGDSVYSVTIESNESVQLITGLDYGNYIINDTSTIIAWHENGSKYEANSIRILNIETGKDYRIEANEEEYVRVLGFIGDDLIYGGARKEDVIYDEAGYATFPMYKINININDGENIQTYAKDGIYVKGIEIDGNMIKLQRVVKTNAGEYKDTTDDRFISQEFIVGSGTEMSVITTELKKKELVINYAYTITEQSKLRTIYPLAVIYGEGEERRIGNLNEVDNKYYVYACGRLWGVYDRGAEALREANKMYGIVVDSKGNTLWARIMRPNYSNLGQIEVINGTDQSTIDMALKTIFNYNGKYSEELSTKGDPIEVLRKMEGYLVVDFSGGELLNSVYYIAGGQPVLTKMDNSYYLITAYSGTLSSIDEFSVLDVRNGKITTYKTADLINKLQKHDSILIGICEKK